MTNGLKLSERTLVSAGAKLSKDTVEGSICFPARAVVITDKIPEDYVSAGNTHEKKEESGMKKDLNSYRNSGGGYSNISFIQLPDGRVA